MTLVPPTAADAQVRSNGHNGVQFRPCYPPRHTCGAPLQHDLLLWTYQHPLATMKQASVELHKSYPLIKMTAIRLRRRPDYAFVCPFCFSPSRFNHVCTACGVEFNGHSQQARVEFDSQSPVHTILPGRGLGSSLSFEEYQKLARLTISHSEKEALTSPQVNKLINNLAAVMKQQGSGKEDSLIKSIKSDILQALKEACPDDQVSDAAAVMVEEEVREFRLRYQLGHAPRGLRESIGRRVIARLGILHPELKGKLKLPGPARKLKKRVTVLPREAVNTPDSTFEVEHEGVLPGEAS